MSLMSDGALAIVRLSGGWGGTLSVGMHNPPMESCDMRSSQSLPLIDWVASDTVDERVDFDCCDGAVGGVVELGSRIFLL
jgi:hypothetical protein